VMSDVFAHIDRIASFDACVGPQAKVPASGPVRRQNSELGKKITGFPAGCVSRQFAELQVWRKPVWRPFAEPRISG
jgi:hypothetical protein